MSILNPFVLQKCQFQISIAFKVKIATQKIYLGSSLVKIKL